MHNIFPHDTPKEKWHLTNRRLFLKNCDWIRVFDENTIEKAKALYNVHNVPFYVVPEGSYAEYYPNDVSKAAARVRFNYDNNNRVLLFLGFIKPYKGVDDLLKCFIKRAPENWRLLIAGKCSSDAYRQEIEDLRNNDNRITFHPTFVAAEDLQYYYQAANVVVLPFKEIANSGSVILAMGFGCPVLAPAKGNLNRRLKEQKKLLFDTDLDQGFKKLSKISDSELKLLGEKNAAAAEENKWEDFVRLFKITGA